LHFVHIERARDAGFARVTWRNLTGGIAAMPERMLAELRALGLI